MRTVLIGPVYPYRGGISHHTTMLGRRLQAASECRIISFKRQYPKRIYPGRTDIDPSEEILEVEAEYRLDPLNPLTWLQTAREIIRWEPDHLVIQWWVTVWGPLMTTVAFLCHRAHIPITYMVHNVLPHEERFMDRMISKSTLRWGKHFIVHCEREQARLSELLPEAVVSLLPHPPYDMFKSNRLTGGSAKSALGIAPDVTTLLFFGMVRAYKGLAYVIEATHLMKKEGYKVCLIVAGEFWEDKSYYLQLIQDLELGEEVLLDDRYIPNEQVGLYFSAADIVTVPYIVGTQSGVAAIATSFGLPIITTDHIQSGISTPNSGSIFVVAPGSAQAIAEAAMQILNSSPKMENPAPLVEQTWDRLVQAILTGGRSTSA
jgi:glycosyltransferase involved in cell wall biosynthesis